MKQIFIILSFLVSFSLAAQKPFNIVQADNFVRVIDADGDIERELYLATLGVRNRNTDNFELYDGEYHFAKNINDVTNFATVTSLFNWIEPLRIQAQTCSSDSITIAVLADGDADTKIEVELNPDEDSIHVTAEGIKVITIDSNEVNFLQDVSFGHSTPTATVDIGNAGTPATLRYRDGNQTNGFVLTSDGSGNATWQALGVSDTSSILADADRDTYITPDASGGDSDQIALLVQGEAYMSVANSGVTLLQQSGLSGGTLFNVLDEGFASVFKVDTLGKVTAANDIFGKAIIADSSVTSSNEGAGVHEYRGNRYSNTANSNAILQLRRARGTKASPLDVQAGDALGSVLGMGRISGGYQKGGELVFSAQGVSSGLDTKAELYTVQNNTPALALWADSSQQVYLPAYGDGTLTISSGKIVSGAAGPNNYAGIYADSTVASLSLVTQDQWYQIVSFDTDMPETTSNGDHTQDHITVSGTGDYDINFSHSFSGSNSATIEIAVFLNNGTTELEQVKTRRKLGTGGDVGSASGVGVASLTDGDTVELWARCIDGASKTITPEVVSLSVRKL